jgi:hypothetical protein
MVLQANVHSMRLWKPVRRQLLSLGPPNSRLILRIAAIPSPNKRNQMLRPRLEPVESS